MPNLLKYMIALVGVLLAVVLFVGFTSGGIDRQVVAQAEAEISKIASSKQDVKLNRSQVETLVKADPELYAPREINATQFDGLIKRLEETQPTTEKLRALLNANETESQKVVQQLTTTLAQARVSAITEASSLRDTAQQLADFKKQVNEKIPAMEADIKVVEQFDPSVLEAQVAKAEIDWPEKKQTLRDRLQAYKNLKEKAIAAWESSAQARATVQQNQLNGVDVEKLLSVASVLSQTKTALQTAPQQMESLIDQLYWSWDKILADMELNEGQNVTFRQKFETSKVRALVPESETVDPPTPEVDWKTVDKQTYDKMAESLGMVVEHKPAGKFDSESTKTVQPPGYSYIAPVEQGSNRYGRWERRSDGSSFWAFYGQYAFMRSMFWGPSYRPITPYYYNDYRSHYDTGRPYYGRDNYGKTMYGSNGSVSKSKYANSKFVSTNGYKNSQYVKSGGSYRGSAYQTRKAAASNSSTRNRSMTSPRTSRSTRSYSSRSSGFRSSGGFGGK